jgi:cysteine desulfurase/selenocysteine lyase
MFNIEKIRKDFPILERKMRGQPLIYFDTAATSQKPKAIIDILCDFYLNKYGTVHRAIYELSAEATELYDNVRTKTAKFLNANCEEEIVFVKGTTDGINLIARSYGDTFISKDDEIIITEMEHHSNIVPWQLLCERKQAKLKVIPINDRAELIIDEYEKLLSDKTKLVCVAHVANSTGTVNPIKKIVKMAHEKGAIVLVDGAQAAGHLKVDVKDIDADFYVFSSHKIYGPNGVGILYGKKDILETMPPMQGGGDMITQVKITKTTYQKPPLRFEAGTPVVPEVIAFGATLDYIENIGRENIYLHEKKLLEYATGELEKIPGFKIIGTAEEKAAIISFVVDKTHSLDIGTLLDLEGIAIRTGHHCAQPTLDHFSIESTSRISFGVYNTIEEIDVFVEKLENILKIIKR